MNTFIKPALVCAVLFSRGVQAQEFSFCKSVTLDAGFYTSHPGANHHQGRKKLNRNNPGFGFACEFTEHWHIAGHLITKDSNRGPLKMLELGTLQPVLKLEPVTISIGAELVRVDYGFETGDHVLRNGVALLAALDIAGWQLRPALMAFPGVDGKTHRAKIASVSFGFQYRF